MVESEKTIDEPLKEHNNLKKKRPRKNIKINNSIKTRVENINNGTSLIFIIF